MSNDKEKISINGRLLQYGVLSNEEGYQLYLYPGMTVAEIAFDVMVTIRLLMQDGYIKNKLEFDKLVKKYFTDPQYAPVNKEVRNER
jgi:hypothetical protein